MWNCLSKCAWCPFCQLISNANRLRKWKPKDGLFCLDSKSWERMTACKGHLCSDKEQQPQRKCTAREQGAWWRAAIQINTCPFRSFLQGALYFWVSTLHTWSSSSSAAFCRHLNSPCLMDLKKPIHNIFWGAPGSPIPIRSMLFFARHLGTNILNSLFTNFTWENFYELLLFVISCVEEVFVCAPSGAVN